MNSVLTLKEIRCCNCSMLFGMTGEFYEHRLGNGRTFYCPAGHPQAFTKHADDIKRLEREAKELKSQLFMAEQDATIAKNERTNLRRQLTITRKRVANGVCPCCNRTFKQLAAHMTNKHPDFKEATSYPTPQRKRK